MKNKSGIIAALVLSLAVAGSVFAGVKTQDNGQSGSTAASTKTQSTSMRKKSKTKRHHKTKRAKTMKSSKK